MNLQKILFLSLKEMKKIQLRKVIWRVINSKLLMSSDPVWNRSEMFKLSNIENKWRA